MSCCSMQTRILDINVVHCTFTADDDRVEHYCVDMYGYLALCEYYEENFLNQALVDVIFCNKVPIRYNPSLDGGGLHDGIGTNSDDCRASKVLP